MSFSKKWLFVIVFIVFLVGFFLPVGGSEAKPIAEIEILPRQNDVQKPGCVSLSLDLSASNTMPVPDFCIDGLCKLILNHDAPMGAFGPGYSWEVYYFQLEGYDDRWNGGPNISLGGVEFSDGYGYNGNGIPEAVFRGSTTSDGGYVRIMDDGDDENSPYLWTIESKSSQSLTQASLNVCDIPNEVWSGFILTSTTIPVPEFCVDQMCMILRGTNATFGDFGPGLSMPVYYQQDSTNDEWIGGPNISLGGVDFSNSYGTNGNEYLDVIFGGGMSERGDYLVLYDDYGGIENQDDLWSVLLVNGDELTEVYYYFAPMDCIKHNITEKYTNLTVPNFCVDSLCTIVRWTDGQFGAWLPGLSWPVNYKQSSSFGKWLGGPTLCLGGQCFSGGFGQNGDSSADTIFDSGRTLEEGYVVLRDDSFSAEELEQSKWNVVFNAKNDLTAASYYICSNTCEETVLMINKIYLPLTLK